MDQYRGIQAFDITTSCDLFFPERVFALVGALNACCVDRTGAEIGVEVYPTRPTPWACVDPDHVRAWQARHGARARRVHLEFVCDRAELRYVLRSHQRESLANRILLRAMYSLLPDATTGRGVSLATDLGLAVNVHANVLVRWRQTGQLATLARNVPEILAENNILADYLYVNGPITFDPRLIAVDLVGAGQATGLLLAIDHLIDHYPTQRIDPVEVLDDADVRQATRVIHIAGARHAAIKPGDPHIEPVLRKIALTPFVHPVRLAFDYGPIAMLGMSFDRKLRLFGDSIAWIRKLHQAA